MSFLHQNVEVLGASELKFFHREAEAFFDQCRGAMDSLNAHAAAFETSRGDMKRAEEFLSSIAFASFFFVLVGVSMSVIIA